LTNAAPPFELTPYAGKVWRFVEDQNTSSTMKLVDTMDEHAILEELLDASKPPVPVACQHLHYLQFTPFRYPARHATRFRRKGDRRGVYYAAETIQTAATEVAFYRMLFFVESPETDPPKAPFAMSVFSTEIDTPRALDMVAACDADLRADCADPVDYALWRAGDLRRTRLWPGADGVSVRELCGGSARDGVGSVRCVAGTHLMITPASFLHSLHQLLALALPKLRRVMRRRS